MGSRIDYGYETWTEKFKRKFNENPWVPVGCLATTGALLMASVKMRAGKSKDMQYWLRARVAFQGLTLVALVAGSMAIQAQRKQQLNESGVDETLPRNEATTELINQRKKEKEKAEFEERLKGAEMADAEERAAIAQFLNSSKGSGRGTTETPDVQVAVNAPENSKSRGSWSWFGWSSSRKEQDDTNRKS